VTSIGFEVREALRRLWGNRGENRGVASVNSIIGRGCLKVSLLLENVDWKSGATKVWCASREVRGRGKCGAIIKSKLAKV